MDETPLGTEVDLGPGHIVLDGDPAALRKGHSSPDALFSAHVYCGHGRPSQLLLSSCPHLLQKYRKFPINVMVSLSRTLKSI